MRDRLILRERRAVIRAQGFALDVLDQSPAVVGVGQDADREVALGHDLEQQDVAAERAAVRGHAQRADAAASATPRPISSSVHCFCSCGVRISSSDARDSTRSPFAAVPSPRWNFA